MKKETLRQTSSLLNYDREPAFRQVASGMPKFKLDENYIAEGDNLDTLNILLSTHKNKIDVIYIDPPYNTQKNHFKYSDKMLRQEWCSFMFKRLVLAKELLKPSGSIFISIGDQAYAYLKILCDDVFGEENFVSNFIWKKSHTVKNDSQSISTQHEYVLCFSKNKKIAFFNQDKIGDDYINKAYRYSDESGRFRVVPLHKEKNKNSFKVISPTGIQWIKNWNYNESGFNQLIAESKIYWGKTGEACPSKKVYLKPDMLKTFGSIFDPDEVKYTGNGIKELKKLGFISSDFLYPKPVELIVHILKIASKKDSIILDFFAGSGTTGQAVMELNHDDGGNRKFILGTNNENNICKDITVPRLLKAKDYYHYQDDFNLVEVPDGNINNRK